MWLWNNSSWTSWDYFQIRSVETRGIIAVLVTALKNFKVGMHSEVHKSIWFKLGMVIDIIVMYILILVFLTVTFTVHRSARKQNTSAPMISQSFELIWMEIGILLIHISVMNFILFFWGGGGVGVGVGGVHSVFKGKILLIWFCCKPCNIGLYLDIYWLISFILGMMMETLKHYILISVWMILMFIQGHSYMRTKKIQCPFSCKSR